MFNQLTLTIQFTGILCIRNVSLISDMEQLSKVDNLSWMEPPQPLGWGGPTWWRSLVVMCGFGYYGFIGIKQVVFWVHGGNKMNRKSFKEKTHQATKSNIDRLVTSFKPLHKWLWGFIIWSKVKKTKPNNINLRSPICQTSENQSILANNQHTVFSFGQASIFLRYQIKFQEACVIIILAHYFWNKKPMYHDKAYLVRNHYEYFEMTMYLYHIFSKKF